jgi:hypothetical protein
VKKRLQFPGFSGCAAAFSVYGNGLKLKAKSAWEERLIHSVKIDNQPIPDFNDVTHHSVKHKILSSDMMNDCFYFCDLKHIHGSRGCHQVKTDKSEQYSYDENRSFCFELHFVFSFLCHDHFLTSNIRILDQKGCLFIAHITKFI